MLVGAVQGLCTLWENFASPTAITEYMVDHKRGSNWCLNIAALWFCIAAQVESILVQLLAGIEMVNQHLSKGMKESCMVLARKSSGRECCCELVGMSLPLFSKTNKKESQSPRCTALVLADRLKKSWLRVFGRPGCSFQYLFFLHSGVCFVIVCDRPLLLVLSLHCDMRHRCRAI